ncbi:luciferase family protein [Streptomyces sp. NPDC058690]|uniref:luciferase family protein n=1 Tax=Streptomyces sp. NPDC058690 TaxID=3346600 RepID=UPI00365E5FDD
MSWPGLTGGRASCGSEYCLLAGTVELVHFHGEQEADVRLTRRMIARLRPGSADRLPLSVMVFSRSLDVNASPGPRVRDGTALVTWWLWRRPRSASRWSSGG